MFSAQSGKTEILLNYAGFVIDQDPGPMLVIQPNTSPMGEAFAKDRIAPMIRDTEALKNKVSSAKGRVSGNTMLHKTFPGGQITIGGANSPAGLASRPIRYLAFDEIDRYEVTKEGSAVALATKRTRTFHNRKILKVSTPTLADMGIHAEYQNAEQQYEWHLTCPDCEETQRPALKHFHRQDPDWKDVVYVCEHCGTEHPLEMESRIKASGQWVQMRDEGYLKKAYWMNQWASPFATWRETLTEFVEADRSKDRSKLQTVVNTAFAEPWEEAGEAVDETGLMARREPYTVETLPSGILVLVAGVDVQDDRLECEVIGYGAGYESWGVDYKVIWGDPAQPQVWQDLDDALKQTYTVGDIELHVAATAVDSGGHHTQQVYSYCKTRQFRRVFAIKGMAGEGKPIVSAPSKKRYGAVKRPVPLFTVGVDSAKLNLYANLRLSEPGPGYCHFPQVYQEEYFLQLTAERLVTKYKKGFPYRVWEAKRARNEALDIRVYAMAALSLLNPNFEAIKARHEPKEPEEPKPDPIIKRRQPAKKKGGFVNSWR